MTTEVREYTNVDKDGWGSGAWQNEPDKIQWVDATTNLDCLMKRHPTSGHWCGYVGVAEPHPVFEKNYDDVNVDVHGGLTYAAFCDERENPAEGICHVPFEGRPHRVWWLGFDCAHSGDESPGMRRWNREHGFSREWEAYRDRRYVEHEVRSLATQLRAMQPEV